MDKMRFKFTLFFLAASVFVVNAQQAFTIQEAVVYAKKNNAASKNALVDIQDAELQIQELKQTGLPQITGQFQYSYNAIVPSVILPANTFDPTAPEGAVTTAQFGVPWGAQAGIAVNQLIFDGSYLVGLRAAATYRELAAKNKLQNDVTITESVTKAYYSVLVAEERAKILNLNVNRLDSLIRDTQILFQEGFAEGIDVMRLEVQRNNLFTERQKVENLIDLSYQLLKFQMGYRLENPIELKDQLEGSDITALRIISNMPIDYGNRIEFSLLETQRRLSELNMERIQKGALPSVFFSGSLGANHGNRQFNPFQNWFGLSTLTLGVNVPIYDSGIRKTQAQREQLNLIKLDNGAEQLKESFELQNSQAITNLTNGIQTLDVQQSNVDLAKEVLRVSNIKYKAGVGSNIEVINAEASLKESQTNYFAALYDVLIAKVDLDLARGDLK
jgi:outer membrane protein TolC